MSAIKYSWVQLIEWRSANNYNWVQLSIYSWVQFMIFLFRYFLRQYNQTWLWYFGPGLHSTPFCRHRTGEWSLAFSHGPIINHSILWKEKTLSPPPYTTTYHTFEITLKINEERAFFASMVITRQSRPKGDEMCRKFCSIINFGLRLSLFLLHIFSHSNL